MLINNKIKKDKRLGRATASRLQIVSSSLKKKDSNWNLVKDTL